MKPWFNRLLSGDWPRSRWLAAALLLTLLGLGLAPWLFTSVKAINVAAKILIFVVLVASYDLLLGYTGIVSFAHTLFFGMGAYGVAIAMTDQPSWVNLGLGVLVSLILSMVLALLIGLFSLRVRAIFFAMITLAVASAFMTLASQLSGLTGGEDGLTFKLPLWLSPSFEWADEPLALPWGEVELNGRLLAYYLLFVTALVLFLVMLRWVNSPFGRVLQAIRENEFRAEALGYPIVIYRTLANVFSALMATLAGCMLAIWLRYNGPDTSLSFEIMLDVLLMVVIGGMGTLYGAVIGSGLFLLAQNYLQDALAALAQLTAPWPILSALFTPNRWLLWLGLMFVLSVYHFPSGIVGVLRQRHRDRQAQAQAD
ncbi:MAG: hypothetical protein RL307_175 [Pseudomonadota bacterium]|jgi:branched-chain amino acid transport system permease protein